MLMMGLSEFVFVCMFVYKCMCVYRGYGSLFLCVCMCICMYISVRVCTDK